METTLTTSEAAIGGAVLGGMLVGIIITALIVYVLLIIAMWKIFTKAGEAGWKSIIPVYNLYIYLKIAGMQNYFWVILGLSLLQSIVQVTAGKEAVITLIVTLVYAIAFIVIEIMHCVKLSKAFGHGAGYAVGLIFLPNIFTLILGFGKDEYVGVEGK